MPGSTPNAPPLITPQSVRRDPTAATADNYGKNACLRVTAGDRSPTPSLVSLKALQW